MAPATPRRASARKAKTPPKKTLSLGSPLGPGDNNTVRDRVRQWQSQGGGVIVQEDLLAEIENEEPEPVKSKDSPKVVAKQTPHKATESGESPTPKRRSGRRKEQDHPESKRQPRSVSAPRKRIVSDGHWVKTRSTPPQKSKVKIEHRSTPSWALPDDGIRVKPLDSPSDRGSDVSREPVRRNKVSHNFDDGIRVYSTPTSSRKPSELLDADFSDVEKLSAAENSRSQSPTRVSSSRKQKATQSCEITPEKSPRSEKGSTSGGRHESERKDKTPGENNIKRSIQRPTPRTSNARKEPRKTSHGNLFTNVFSTSKKIFTKTETPQIQPPRAPRTIETWLNSTADPFSDNDHAMYVETAPRPPDTVVAESIFHGESNAGENSGSDDGEPPVEVPAPLKLTRRRKRHSAETAKTFESKTSEDPNAIWDSISQRAEKAHKRELRRERRARTFSHPAEEPIQEASEDTEVHEQAHDEREEDRATVMREASPDLSPSSLRRRGARRDGAATESPQKTRDRQRSSPLKESFTPTEVTQEELGKRVASDKINDDSRQGFKGSRRRVEKQTTHSPRHFVAGEKKLSTIASEGSFELSQQTSRRLGSVQDGENRHGDRRTEHTPKAAPSPQSANHGEITSSHRGPINRDPESIKSSSDLALSTSKPRTKSIRSSRSIRSTRSKLEVGTVQDVLAELISDEARYMRELQTLVDGVIPVLLASALSKSDSAITAGLFSPSRAALASPELTKIICDMGVALERLKRAHKRIPVTNIDSFYTWAHGAAIIYKDYFKAWRMGFQDVVVNLAPAADEATANTNPTDAEGLPRNERGDVVGENGEPVDVAHLLKRPLVRVKYLSKTSRKFADLHSSDEANDVTKLFENLTEEARTRNSEERERIEDEAAAATDPTRARDPKTLGPLAGVIIDPTRRVKARDFFNLTLFHTSGQRIDCRVEMLLRENTSRNDPGGDLLIAEIDDTFKWLLFPPMQLGKLSARNGDEPGEIIVMLRGTQTGGEEWQELLVLQTEDEQTGVEWLQMLGQYPVPPNIMRTHSFINRAERRRTLALPAPPSLDDSINTPLKSRTPSPREIEIPFGEKPTGTVRTWVESPARHDPLLSSKSSRLPISEPSTPGTALSESSRASSDGRSSLPSQKHRQYESESPSSPAAFGESLRAAGSPTSGLKRTKAKRQSRYLPDENVESAHPALLEAITQPTVQSKLASSHRPSSASSTPIQKARPKHHRSSSVPTLDLPIIPKVRKDSPPTTPVADLDEEPLWIVESVTPKASKVSRILSEPDEGEKPPPPPPHRTPSPVQLGGTTTPDLSSGGAQKGHRRTSSPLKHEYEPSSATESDSDQESTHTVEHYEDDTPDSSDDLEDDDVPGPLPQWSALNRRARSSARAHYIGQPSEQKAESIAPSSSASNYRGSPGNSLPETCRTSIGTVFSWSGTGTWNPMHEDCTIAITPGLFEVFDTMEYNIRSKPGFLGTVDIKPLLSLELTPVVCIRKGTALDVTLRKDSFNFMIRSRSPSECDLLYGFVNWARLNNIRYEIALEEAQKLQQARQFGGASFNTDDGSRKSGSRFFGFSSRKGSFRARSRASRSAALTENTHDSSTSSKSAVFKLLKSSRFSIARSTITSRQGSGKASTRVSSEGTGGGSGTSTPVPGVVGEATPLGLSNIKVNFRLRDGDIWRDRGTAFLTIVRPREAGDPLAPGIVGGDFDSEGDILAATPHPVTGTPDMTPASPQAGAKRIIVVAKQSEKDEKNAKPKSILLDVILGQDNFELMSSRTIVMAVKEDHAAPTHTGGVGMTKTTKYSLQFDKATHASYVFNIVSRNRYARPESRA